MALKVLPNDVRSLLSASAQINNYKTAVEELVYNSLDAESTSIAIRVNIPENKIQVIDNGFGIAKIDFDALGIRYMTSKFTDHSTLKSTSKCYGYRGEFLANIVEISHSVKIISRHKKSEETWVKTFRNAKVKHVTKMTTRPSKGTTVEIRGFLYNLNIRKQEIDPINDLQNIKTFLEQLSLVHNDISLSLRDDSKNEIIYQIHKKRDVYQTLWTLFNIKKPSVQELQVEKNHYKVKALIGNQDLQIGRHWIYLNGRFVPNGSKLHKIINEFFKRCLSSKEKKKSKCKNDHDEDYLFKQNIPFYFLFITCPNIDYDINTTRRRSSVEFRNWDQINKMLEKLVKFYIGDIRLKEIGTTEKNVADQQDIKGNDNTRDQIKRIIDKILGSNSKKLGVSQLQNGVKGKLIKRKNKKKTKSINSKNLLLKVDGQTRCKSNENNTSNRCIQNMHIDTRSKEIATEADNYKNDSEDNPGIQHSPKTRKGENNIIIPNSIKTVKSNMDDKSNMKRKTLKTKKKSKEEACIKVHKTKKTNQNKIKPVETRVEDYVNMKRDNFKWNGMFNNAKQFLPETDSVSRKCRRVAQEAEELLKHQNRYGVIRAKYKNTGKNTRNTITHYKSHTDGMNYKINNNVIFKIKPFKTTYDLIHTILETEQEKETHYTNDTLANRFKYYPIIEQKQTFTSKRKTVMSLNHNSPSNSPLGDVTSRNINTEYRLEEEKNFNFTSGNLSSYHFSCENNNNRSEYTELEFGYKGAINFPTASPQQNLRYQDIFRENTGVPFSQHEPSCEWSNIPTVSLLTYESHNYYRQNFDSDKNKNENKNDNKNRYTKRTQAIRFITKQSRDNFIATKDKYRAIHRSHFKPRCEIQNKNQTNNLYRREMMNESYIIEFTKSNDINYSILVSNQTKFTHCENGDSNSIQEILSPNYEPSLAFGKTYTIPTYTISSECVNNSQFSNERTAFNEIEVHNVISDSNTNEQYCHVSATDPNNANNNHSENDEVNIVFVSKSHCSVDKKTPSEERIHIEPINVCETILSNENGTMDNEFAFSFNRNSRLDDSLYNNFEEFNQNTHSIQKYTQIVTNGDTDDNVSHHFNNTLTSKYYTKVDECQPNMQTEYILENTNTDRQENHILHNVNKQDFELKDRLRFLPKGMSQIFEKCGSKTICDYNLDEECYEDIIYDEFANDVQMQTEVYEPVIQNIQDFATKDIHNFKTKVQKDNTSLVFDENSLKEAKVLNQVDCKFIAVIVNEKVTDPKNKNSEYLVLFDQHAVHERIRLEQSLKDYINQDKWKSIALDNNITMKITKDEILYLHNYKDKFCQLGLQWTVVNKDEILISSIPEAILGKNPREVDKVMKAVKNLIVEEINVIKLQKGCISLYPKSIMDLVFSEACRYAIKFGDKLSKNDCIDLLNDLSNCKTPFQCAHGRPVMAVLLDIKSDNPVYKIDIASVLRYKQSSRISNKTIN